MFILAHTAYNMFHIAAGGRKSKCKWVVICLQIAVKSPKTVENVR